MVVWLPPDTEAVVVDIAPMPLGDPAHRVIGVKGTASFRLRESGSVTSNNAGDAAIAFFPRVPDVPVHRIDDHSIQTSVHPETDYLFRLARPCVVYPVVLWKMNGVPVFVFARPSSPIVVLATFVPLPELCFGSFVICETWPHEEIAF